MKAKRINGFAEIDIEQICYYKSDTGWMLFHPESGLGSLENHEVKEHEDGTITVKPSIQIRTRNKGKDVSVHGFLEKGRWREA